VLAVIEHASRRIRILGATSHPAASWAAQAAKNLIMDLEDAGSRARFLIRDRDGKFSGLFDDVLKDAGIEIVLSGVQMPRMNAFMERWVQTCRRELLDRTLIWNQRHLLHALREFEQFYNSHRPHQGIANARPLRALPSPIPEPDAATGLHIHRRDRLGGIFHEYRHAALPARMNFRQARGVCSAGPPRATAAARSRIPYNHSLPVTGAQPDARSGRPSPGNRENSLQGRQGGAFPCRSAICLSSWLVI
jgi:putative transposase